MTRPLVSVLIPQKNVVKYVADALDSICAQDYENIEVLVVDDGSEDGSPDVVSGYPDARVRLLISPGRGISDAFNHGLNAARGDYIIRCDADDWFVPGRVRQQVTWMERWADVVACAGLFEICWEDGTTVLEAQPERATERSIRAELLAGARTPRMVCAIFRTTALRAIGGCRRYFVTCQDDDVMLRIAEHGDVWEVPDVIYRARLRDSSICRTTNRARLDWFMARCYEFHEQRMQRGSDDLELGVAPQPPEFPASTITRAQSFAQNYLLGDAWRYVDRGAYRTAARKVAYAIHLGPWRVTVMRQILHMLAVATWRQLRGRAARAPIQRTTRSEQRSPTGSTPS